MNVALLAILLASFVLVDCQIGCRDENNNLVDWYYIYKVPKNKFTKNDLIKQGVAYLYVTSETVKRGWTLSDVSVNSTDSMPGLTLNPLYMKNNNILSVVYNDQPPEEANKISKTSKTANVVEPEEKPGYFTRFINYILRRKTREVEMVERIEADLDARLRVKTTGGGHTKGVVIADATSGIWLVHSVPKYPPLPNKEKKYSYPLTGTKFGQSYLCLSLPGSEVDKIGDQLKYNEPNILFSNLPSSLKNQYNSIVDVTKGKTVKSAPWSHTVNLTTSGKTKFLSFAKSAKFNADLYESLVAPTFDTDLLVETWRNGRGALDSECKLKYKVNNVDKIAFADEGIAFSSSSDHSKWAVSVLNANSDCQIQCSRDRWVCIGDINRAETQESRGGGTVCIKDVNMWSHYSKLINAIEDCTGKTKDFHFVSTFKG